MTEYIPREAALTEFQKVCDVCMTLTKRPMCGDCSVADTVREIKRIPAADVREVRWIPVTERLPEDNERVLTLGPKGGIQVCRFRDSTPLLKWHFWTAGNARIATVTHWMPLPHPPKEATE